MNKIVDTEESFPKVFAAWCIDHNDRAQSTSGGMFSAVANYCLSNGGMVVAAKYGQGLRIEHGIAVRSSDLDSMRGVKYAHGSIGKDIYDAVKANLSNKCVAFFGLPCQCAAIRKMFGQSNNLLLVDLVCFGAPPMHLWLKYVEWLEREHGKRLISVNPRDKVNGWGRKTYYQYKWADGTSSSQPSLFDPYAQVFYSRLGFRRCCFSCPFRGIARQTDMTIGDCWGVENMGLGLSKEEISLGVSGVFLHNARARKIFDKLEVCRMEIGIEELVRENLPIVASPNMPEAWLRFSKDAETLDFANLIEKWNLRVTRLEFFINCVKFAVRRILAGKTT